MKQRVIEFIAKLGRVMVPQDSIRDIRTELYHLARRQSAEYVSDHMGSVPMVDSDLKVLDIALDQVREGGLFLEFGVFSGRTINHIASKIRGEVHGFDSFEGLPEFWRDGFDKGHFARSDLPAVVGNVRLHKGWFEDSIPPFLQGSGKDAGFVSFLHVDCDLYSSTKTIFDKLGHLVKDGTVVVFDEYFNYPGWKDGEWKAFQEFVRARRLAYRYLAFNFAHEQVALVITGEEQAF